MPFPSDIPNRTWDPGNLQKWSDPQVTTIGSVQLQPLEAKALHVIGTLVQIFDSVGYLLYCGPGGRPYANYYLYAYLLACTAIELLGRCQSGETNIAASTLRTGLQNVGLDNVTVNVQRNGQVVGYTYNVVKLSALRNLASHGQAVASANRQSQDVFLHVELLDSFPSQLMQAYDSYYNDLFVSTNPSMRRMLAISAVEPVLYSQESGQVFISPIQKAYNEIYQAGVTPSQILTHTNWQVYNP